MGQAGWYPDPHGQDGRLRWFNGERWTDEVAPGGRTGALTEERSTLTLRGTTNVALFDGRTLEIRPNPNSSFRSYGNLRISVGMLDHVSLEMERQTVLRVTFHLRGEYSVPPEARLDPLSVSVVGTPEDRGGATRFAEGLEAAAARASPEMPPAGLLRLRHQRPPPALNPTPTIPTSASKPSWWALRFHPVYASFVVLAVVGFVIARITLANRATSPSTVAPDLGQEVVYFVEGTATSVDITYVTLTGIRQQSGLAVPLMARSGSGPGLRLGRVPAGTFVSISAQNQDERGTVTCRIEADGRVISQNTSSGAYVIASCEGSV